MVALSKTMQKKMAKGSNFVVKNLSLTAKSGETFKVVMKKSSELSAVDKEVIYSIFDVNMSEMYIASPWGLDVEKKKGELFHENSRFFLVMTESNDICAYAMVRYEPNDEDEPEYPVVYLYEFQIRPDHQGRGLGQGLVGILRDIGVRTEMKKIMLTCFKSNVRAVRFYEKLGFVIDSQSPSQWGDATQCYDIFSLRI